MIGYIYKTTNTVTGTIYIGKRQKPKYEASYKGSGTILKQAFAKYGKDAFSTCIIEECSTAPELCDAEKRWIKQYREKGVDMYNIADGGDGGVLCRWWEFPDEKKKQVIEKNRQAHLGKKNPMYGTRMSEHDKEYRRRIAKGKKLSDSAKAKIRDGKRKHLRPIAQIDKKSGVVIRVWENWGEASEQFKEQHGRCAYSHISDCCNGKRKSAFGFKWEYAEVTV